MVLVYLPTFGWFLGQMLVSIPYMEHLGYTMRGPHCIALLSFFAIWSLDAPASGDWHLSSYPLVICYIVIEHGHRNSGFTHWKWWFSIVMLVYQRVCHLCYHDCQSDCTYSYCGYYHCISFSENRAPQILIIFMFPIKIAIFGYTAFSYAPKHNMSQILLINI